MKANRITPVVSFLCMGLVAVLIAMIETSRSCGVWRDAGLRANTEIAVPAEARFDNFRVTILP
jgi:hypothetical protein